MIKFIMTHSFFWVCSKNDYEREIKSVVLSFRIGKFSYVWDRGFGILEFLSWIGIQIFLLLLHLNENLWGLRELKQWQEMAQGNGIIISWGKMFLLRCPWWQQVGFCGWIPVWIQGSRLSYRACTHYCFRQYKLYLSVLSCQNQVIRQVTFT